MVHSGNTCTFYRYANSKLKSRISVAPLITPSGDVISDPIVKAEQRNEYFSSIFQTDDSIIPPSHQQLPILSIESVFTIAKLELVYASWTQSHPAVRTMSLIYLLKAVNTLCPPLAHLFSLSYSLSYLPPRWRLAYITPIFKKGDPACVSNYRPISLTSLTIHNQRHSVFIFTCCRSNI